MTGLRFSTVNIGAPDPAALARFYERLLGWRIGHEEPDFVIVRDPDGGVSLSCQREEDYVPPVWPAGPGDQQMQLHLEIAVRDLDSSVAHALECGATTGAGPAAGRRAGLPRPRRAPVLPLAGDLERADTGRMLALETDGETVVDTDIAYRADDPVLIRVRRREHRYDLTDDGGAVERAGRRTRLARGRATGRRQHRHERQPPRRGVRARRRGSRPGRTGHAPGRDLAPGLPGPSGALGRLPDMGLGRDDIVRRYQAYLDACNRRAWDELATVRR